jgi:hypothetical protein
MGRNQSNGTTGEALSELFFKGQGWKMSRHQPPTRVVYIKGKPSIIPCKTDGVPDYTGYEIVQLFPQAMPIFRACEVKEADGDRMPASRLSQAQRDWMNERDQRCMFVGICWTDKNPIVFELFHFVYTGSYKRGQGLLRKKF